MVWVGAVLGVLCGFNTHTERLFSPIIRHENLQ